MMYRIFSYFYVFFDCIGIILVYYLCVLKLKSKSNLQINNLHYSLPSNCRYFISFITMLI